MDLSQVFSRLGLEESEETFYPIKKLTCCADYGKYTYHMSTERAKQVQVLKLLYLVQSAGGLL